MQHSFIPSSKATQTTLPKQHATCISFLFDNKATLLQTDTAAAAAAAVTAVTGCRNIALEMAGSVLLLLVVIGCEEGGVDTRRLQGL